MNSLFKAREAAFNLASSKYKAGDPNYIKYSPIYIASTSNVVDTLKLYRDYNSVLSVGGTGSHGYEALLNGATTVDLFDINELQRLYYEYMKTAIMYLDYKNFVKHFSLPENKTMVTTNDLKNLLSQYLYDSLVYYIPEDVEFVLTPLYDYFDSISLVTSGLFRFEHTISLDYLKKNISFYNEEEYYKLQKKLRNNEGIIKYKNVSLTDIPKKFNDKYDLIILDNILQYYKKISGLETPYAVNMFINKNLSNLLNENGNIQVNYGFEVATDAFKMEIEKDYQGENHGFVASLMLNQEKREGINIPLVKKWDKYSYDYIRGVERHEGRNSDNLVLTYRKK